MHSVSLPPDPMRILPRPARDLVFFHDATFPDQVAITPTPAGPLLVRVDEAHELPVVVADDHAPRARFATAADAALFLDAQRRLGMTKPWTCWLPRPVMRALERLGRAV